MGATGQKKRGMDRVQSNCNQSKVRTEHRETLSFGAGFVWFLARGKGSKGAQKDGDE